MYENYGTKKIYNSVGTLAKHFRAPSYWSGNKGSKIGLIILIFSGWKLITKPEQMAPQYPQKTHCQRVWFNKVSNHTI